MIAMHRVSMKFAKFPDGKLGMFGRSVILGLTGNPAFPNLPVSLAGLTAATDDFWNTFADSWGGGTLQTAAKNGARARLVSVLRDTAHYVQIAAKNDLPTLLSSGFTTTDRNTAQTQLIAPVIQKVLNHYSTQLWLQVKRAPNARYYRVRLKIGEGEWQDAGMFSQARKIVLKNLTPGTVYTMQVQALGGSTGYSNWSLPISCMAT